MPEEELPLDTGEITAREFAVLEWAIVLENVRMAPQWLDALKHKSEEAK
jgi:hypothetical protein